MARRLQRGFDAIIKELPQLALRRLAERKLNLLGISMPEAAIDKLVDHLSNNEGDLFRWPSNGADNENSEKIEISSNDDDFAYLSQSTERLIASLPDIIERSSTEGATRAFRSMKRRWVYEGATQRFEVDQFCENLEARWGQGLDLLRMLLTCCREVGQQAPKRHRRSKSKKYVHRRYVLTRLHVRACQVTDEIISLLHNGFADGAMARWRTLHELSITAAFIKHGDEDLAKRYIDHQAVDVKRQADEYIENYEVLGLRPLSTRDIKRIDQRYKASLVQYGDAFRTPYGWAANALNNGKPTFKDIQKWVGHSSMGPYYKLASQNVHAGSRAMFFRLSDMGDDENLISGRTNAGIVEPGQNTALSLVQITGTILDAKADMDRAVEMKAIVMMRDAVPRALMKAENKLRRDEAALKRKKN